jgi:leucyl aminopeptidase (aminopeptidase T)
MAWTPNWTALAEQIVIRTLQLQVGERVLYLADPSVHPDLLDAVRATVLKAGGIEHATLLNWTPRLAALRTPQGWHPDEEARQREDRAALELFQTADVLIWLPPDWLRRGAFTFGQSEWVLGRWRGRSVHFHWFPEPGRPPDDPVHERLSRAYERAILDLDYAALRSRQERLVSAIRGRTLRVTTPDGTDMTVRLSRDGWYCLNDGVVSRAKALRAVCARDREEELPCGAVRTLPLADSAHGVIRYRRRQAIFSASVGLDAYTDQLDLVFDHGHLTALRVAHDQAELNRQWEAQTGDKDRLSEIVFGTNPLLPLHVEGARVPPYWAFGAGGFRFHLGDIVESGGPFKSSFAAECWLTDATVEADGETIIRDGRLLVE